MSMASEHEKSIVEQYVAAYLEENLPRVINEVIDERIRQENMAVLKKFMNPDLKIFGE